MITLACDFEEVFEQAVLAAVQTLLECLPSNPSFSESLIFLDSAYRLKEDLFDTI